MEIDHKSANTVVDVAGSAPDTDISPNKQWAVLHLTRNADPIIARDRPATGADMSAINISGTVDVHHRPAEDISKSSEFRFGFIQLARHTVEYALFAGRKSRDGFISINFAAQPALNFAAQPAYQHKFAYEFVLDCGPESYGKDVLPFVNPRAPVIFPKRNNKGSLVPGVSTVVADMDDHPNARMRLAFQNKETGMVTYLAQAMREVYFVTAFVVRDQQKKITILAHVCWRALWKAQYHWVGGDCMPYPVAGTFDAEKPIKGPPTGPI
jgi:hypothetical protein